MKLLNSNKRHKQAEKPQVYNTTGFKDTLASPVFYPVIVVSLVLGITSIFGFLQEPLRLKQVATAIHQKVSPMAVNDRAPQTYSLNDEMSAKALADEIINSYKENSNERQSQHSMLKELENTQGRLHPVAFNYDVTSENFWADLDSSKIESVSEEIQRESLDASVIGVPLEAEFQELNQAIDAKNGSLYTLNNSYTN